MRKIMWIFIVVVTMIALQIGQVSDVFAGQEWKEARGQAFNCSIAGLWESSTGNFAAIVPLDPTGKRYLTTFDSPPPGGPFGVPSINWSLTHGIVDKIGPNLYKYTLHRNGREGGAIVYKIVVNGLTEFTDCDTRVLTYTFQIYDGEGGIVVGCTVPELGYVSRIKPEEPCDDLEPFPDE